MHEALNLPSHLHLPVQRSIIYQLILSRSVYKHGGGKSLACDSRLEEHPPPLLSDSRKYRTGPPRNHQTTRHRPGPDRALGLTDSDTSGFKYGGAQDATEDPESKTTKKTVKWAASYGDNNRNKRREAKSQQKAGRALSCNIKARGRAVPNKWGGGGSKLKYG